MLQCTGLRVRDVLQLPRASLDSLRSCSEPSLWLEPPGETRLYVRQPPAAHYDPDNTKLFKDLGVAHITYPPVFAVGVPRGYLVGFRTIVLYDATFFNDEPWLST